MKFTFFTFALFSILLISCKKKTVEPIPEMAVCNLPTVNEYYPLKVGSYWIYENVFIDSNGSVSITGWPDTVMVIGDTMINGNLFSIFKGSFFISPNNTFYYRDSSGITVDSYGHIFFNPFDSNIYTSIDILLPEFLHTNQTLALSNAFVNVPAGTFGKIADRRGRMSRVDGTPINACGDLYFDQHNYYAKNIGMLKFTWGYYSQIFNCQRQERRLIGYYIP